MMQKVARNAVNCMWDDDSQLKGVKEFLVLIYIPRVALLVIPIFRDNWIYPFPQLPHATFFLFSLWRKMRLQGVFSETLTPTAIIRRLAKVVPGRNESAEKSRRREVKLNFSRQSFWYYGFLFHTPPLWDFSLQESTQIGGFVEAKEPFKDTFHLHLYLLSYEFPLLHPSPLLNIYNFYCRTLQRGQYIV